ncbi:MAG TPA: FAD-dependent oxidoreductase [Candidatus Angelobacter sp.]|nr:FAD-dependent oxidoreductase [Candidatus Angelobacter sp.]
MKLGRRKFLGLGSAALVGLSVKSEKKIEGGFVNDAFPMGHLLRDRASFPPAKRIEKFPVVIVGGGIAGLSAAWRLHKRGFRDFVLLEMNAQPGGNARWGENEITAYPWAAHYVPVPGPQATYVRELFEDLGVLKSGQWEERYLAFAPQERLFLYGRWQEGIEPAVGLTPKDREQFQRLESLFAGFRKSGSFTIPLELGRSSKDAALDRISFADWLYQQGFDSRLLLWYMNYACRDDYGALAAGTSAWAGIHYFSSRESEEKGPLTWPEGNGWITRRLLEQVGQHIRTGQMVHRITPAHDGVSVFAGDTEYRAEFLIFAAPTFLAPYLFENFPRLQNFVYSPWLTANLTLERYPESRGAEPSWDTVFLESPTLGYVDAMHQSLRTQVDRTVWTFYWALAEGAPAQNRQFLLDKDWSYWKEAILHDLERVHRDIRQCVSRIDVMRMGHAMIRPAVGSIFSEERHHLPRFHERVLFANSDLSGISIFEEAQYHGVEAAQKVLQKLQGRF